MGVPLSVMLPEDLRQYTVPLGLNAFLDRILYEDMAIRQGFLADDSEDERDPELPPYGPQLDLYFKGRLADNAGLALPSVAGLELVLGAGRIGLDAAADFEAQRFSMTLSADVMRLRFARSLLQPVVQKQIVDPNDPSGQRKITVYEADPDQNKKIELVFQVAVTIDETGSIKVTWPENSPESLTLPPAMIGDTRIVVEGNLGIDFSTTSALPNVTGRALDPEWVGLVVRDFRIYLPPDIAGVLPQQLTGNCLIGSRGLSAVLRGNWLDAAGRPTAIFKEVTQPDGTKKRFYEGAGSFSFFGLPGAMRTLELDVEDNFPVRSEIDAEFLLPFFEAPVAANLGVGLDGSVDLELRSAEEGSQALVKVRKENLFELTIASLGVERRAEQVKFGLSGTIKPLFPGMEWPTFRVDELSIDTKGKIELQGGWLNLREKYQLNFNGFQIEVSKLGFGNSDDGGKWIAFSGGVKLVAGMPAGASVEGLRFTWYEDGRAPKVSLNGVGVEFEVPNALKFTGAVSYDSVKKQFSGAVKLDLVALKMQVDATAVFGTLNGETYLALYLAAEFPAGIPLFATGLGVYGVAGLFAMNMEPNRQPTQPWYALGSQTDWYHSEPKGVTSLQKWTPSGGRMAFGAGVTLGTIADNGHTFSGKMLLAIVFPGPILMLQGSASLLQERTKLDTDANFSALAVLDGRAGTLQVGLDAKYRYDNNGNLIDINGAAEGFFNFNDPNAWRVNVGLKEPRDRRLTARLFKLFDSYSYVMLDPQQLAMGAWVGFKQQWQFGPLNVALEAWIDGNARVSWKPAHFYGDLALHGSARLSVFGFSAGLTVDAKIAADVFDPLHIRGDFSVGIDLPWPLSDIAVNVNLEWGPQPTPPPLPLPLKEIAVEHFKASTSWPLSRVARGTTPPLLLPNYDSNGDGFFEPASGGTVPANLNAVPVVPLDSRPHVTFARNINDDALVGVNAQPVAPEFERIGDPIRNQGPARVRYGLEEIVLEKLRDGEWRPVARKGRTANQPANLPTLYGSWAPVPQMPGGGGRNVGQTKLWLWSKTPFEYTRHSSRAWDEWFSDEYSDYPCQTLAGDGWNFEEIEPNDNLGRDWHHPDEPGLSFGVFSNIMSIVELNRPSHGMSHAFSIMGRDRADIMLPRPTNLVRVMIPDSRFVRFQDFVGRDSGMGVFGAELRGTPERPYLEIKGKDIVRIHYYCEVFLPRTLAKGMNGAIGSAYIPSLNQIIFVEFAGNLSAIDLLTGDYTVLGTGYDRPEDVAVTANGETAYITERGGTLLRVDLTGNANRVNATLVSKGMTAPQQICLDEEAAHVYTVEYVENLSNGRLLRIDLDGPTAGTQTVLASGLDRAVGLIVTSDVSAAYVGEQGDGGRLTRIDLATGAHEVVVRELTEVFHLRWDDVFEDSILVVQREPVNFLIRIDLKDPSIEPDRLRDYLPALPSSVCILPDGRYVVCADQELEIFSRTLLIPKIVDVGANMLVRHFQDEFVRWTQAGEVLEPHSNYRLKVVTTIKARGDRELAGYSRDETATEYAYFRTDGPPGVAMLSAPVTASETASPQVSALGDLSRYVRRTMPALSAPTPQAPVATRLFYRAYDVGVEFDENYVDLMYRIGRRDLSLQLHDSNGAISNQGRRLVLSNQWGRAETVTLTDREERWLSVLGTAGCTLIPLDSIVKNSTFNAASAAHLLPPSSLCEARLVPALLHDDFGGYLSTNAGADGPNGRFERWQVRDDATSAARSNWRIKQEGTPADYEWGQMVKTASSSLVYTNTSELPSDHPEQPSNWTDYRLTVHLRFVNGRAGIVWRYRDDGQHYRFVMEDGKCELMRVVAGQPTRLASDKFTIPDDTFAVSVEVSGSSFRVYHGPDLILSATDSTIKTGSVGFYSSGTETARFSDVYVDDFRSSAPVVYRFSFLSSRFRNFEEHLESFENKTWRVELAGGVNVGPLINAAGLISNAPAEAELRAFDGLFGQLPGVAASTSTVRVTRVHQGVNAIAFLVQSPEPLDWKRIDVHVLRAPLQSTSYTEIPIRVLRKADGAGLVIVSPGASAGSSLLPPGEYRVVFTYRRNNRAKDPDSEILSEAGDTSPEEVTLDLPWETAQPDQSAVDFVEMLVPA